MITTSLTRAVASVGGVALALTAGGIAFADPEQDPAVSIACSYSQVMAAMNEQSPETTAQFNASPGAQSFLRSFLASPPPQRDQMLQQAQGAPDAAQFVNLAGPIANTCDKF